MGPWDEGQMGTDTTDRTTHIVIYQGPQEIRHEDYKSPLLMIKKFKKKTKPKTPSPLLIPSLTTTTQ